MDEEPVTFRTIFEDDHDETHTCSQCGARFDLRDLSEILRHRQPAHDPPRVQ